MGGGPGFNKQSANTVANGTNTWSSSQNSSTVELLKVEQAFSGVNYLEALSKRTKAELGQYLSDEAQNQSGGSIISADTDSIFNKFSIFKYSKFINGAAYQPDAHFIGYAAKQSGDPYTDTVNQNAADGLQVLVDKDKTSKAAATNANLQAAYQKSIDDNLKRMQALKNSANNYAVKNYSAIANPTAKNLIQWASTQSMESVTGFQPYAMTDFMFCKNYGKIPNNRLVTLRRYPFPIGDLIRAPGNLNPIPIAQAVTWFGEGTDNVLSNIGFMNWGLRWEMVGPIDDPQILEGNEVTVTDLMKVFKDIPKLQKLGERLEAVYVGLNGQDAQLTQLSRVEEKLQKYSRELYTQGPYWNRIYGPVNVVNASTRRARGMQDGWDTPFTLNFHYSFRSFSGLSPKIVALDLIASFLNLTYNDATFLGQLARYFPRLGVKFDETTTQMLGELLTSWGTVFNGDINTMMSKMEAVLQSIQASVGETVNNMEQAIKNGKAGEKAEAALVNTFQAGTALALADAIPNLISIKSALSDRPIGEWHLVVGNPMNPIMVMGDLVVSNCILKFDEEMGPDDFPTGCTFTIKLQQGKPRDKVAIERMFNLGEAKLLFTKLRNPSSADDTFGETNNTRFKQFFSTSTGEKGANELTDDDKQAIQQQLGTGSFDRYRNRIRKSYGYAPQMNGKNPVSGDSTVDRMDDSLLWLYFDKDLTKT